MIVRRIVLATFLLLLPGLSGPTQAATDPTAAAAFIDGLGKQAFSTLQQGEMSLAEREAAFGSILRQGFDLNLIGRFVLGKHWRRATPEQQADYLAVFSDFVIKTYARRLGGFSGQSFTITGTQHSGEKKDVMVATRIDRPSGPPIGATWRVREIEGELRIIDVVIEGVSMAVTQRQEFSSVTQRGGIEGLVQVLRAQTQRLSAAAG